MHDLTHYSAFESLTLNRLAAILTNIGEGIPSAISFGKYHYDHHIYLGVPIYDPDLPTVIIYFFKILLIHFIIYSFHFILLYFF